jgi:hypothetical protein
MNLSTGSGTARHSYADRGDDFYRTPPEATRALLKVFPYRNVKIWEPACGDGAISRILEAEGHTVVSTDLVDRGYGISGIDFLMTQESMGPVIVTNPPFKLAAPFVRHALFTLQCAEVWMLLRLAFLESMTRRDILDEGHLRDVYLFRKRLPFMHRDGWSGKTLASSGMPFAWFRWTGSDYPRERDTIIRRIDW